jgi:signal peptidase I
MPEPAPLIAARNRLPIVRRFRREAIDTARSLAGALVIALVIRTVLFQPFTIPSSSMEPTLVTGDYIIVSKFAYGWSRASLPYDPPLFSGRLAGRTAARGDVVVFRLPRDPRQTWVKRVIGLPGDRVQVRGGIVVVNGRVLPQAPLGLAPDHDSPARMAPEARESLPGGRSHLVYAGAASAEAENTPVYVVPSDSYFVMGDNRDNSLDSRWPPEVGVGLLPAENIVGKAEIILASWRPDAALLKPWTWLDLQPGRSLQPVR